MNYRIVELERADGTVTYILEQEDPTNQFGWSSVWRNEDLDEVRKAKAKREKGGGVTGKTRVIE